VTEAISNSQSELACTTIVSPELVAFRHSHSGLAPGRDRTYGVSDRGGAQFVARVMSLPLARRRITAIRKKPTGSRCSPALSGHAIGWSWLDRMS
jgi:hypothetical protein